MQRTLGGVWLGEIGGTNQGSLLLDLEQNRDGVAGFVYIQDVRLGRTVFRIRSATDNILQGSLEPAETPPGTIAGQGMVTAHLTPNGSLEGAWQTAIGTMGTFKAWRRNEEKIINVPKIFLVHGHDEGPKEATARMLERLGLLPVILQEQPSQGRTIIEKFEEQSDVQYAIVLMTPDDVGYPRDCAENKSPRARQNVILELGYFIAKLGREQVCVLRKGDVEMPSDYYGVVYITYDSSRSWQFQIAAELKKTGFNVDLNRLVAPGS